MVVSRSWPAAGMAAGGEVAGGMEESNKEVMAFRYEILLPNMPIIRSVGLGGTVPNSELNSVPNRPNRIFGGRIPQLPLKPNRTKLVSVRNN